MFWLLTEIFGAILLLVMCLFRALGVEYKDGMLGALAVLIFLIYRRLVIAQTERDLLLREMQNHTRCLRNSPVDVREAQCQLCELISDALGKR